MDAFRCGHEKTPENMAPNGVASPRCRTCKCAQSRMVAATEEGRAAAVQRMRKHRGGLHGHRNSQKTACPQGHPFDEGNTYVFNGARQCLTCRYARTIEYYHRKRSNGGFHTEAEWNLLCDQAGNACVRCRSTAPLTRDHIIPVSKGGDNYIENIQPLCRPCNSAKKDRLVHELGAQ